MEFLSKIMWLKDLFFTPLDIRAFRIVTFEVVRCLISYQYENDGYDHAKTQENCQDNVMIDSFVPRFTSEKSEGNNWDKENDKEKNNSH